MKTANVPLVKNGDMSGTINSSPILLDQDVGVYFQAIFTGAPAGNFKLQASADVGIQPAGTAITNWTDYTGSAVSITAAGDYAWDVTTTSARWMRLVYVPSSGSGTLNVQVTTKGV